MLSQTNTKCKQLRMVLILFIVALTGYLGGWYLPISYGDVIDSKNLEKTEVVKSVEINKFESSASEQELPFLWVENELWCPINDQMARWLGFSYQKISGENTIRIQATQQYEIPIAQSSEKKMKLNTALLAVSKSVVSIEDSASSHLLVEKNIKQMNDSTFYFPLSEKNALMLGLRVKSNREKAWFGIEIVEKTLQLTTQTYSSDRSMYIEKISDMVDRVGSEPRLHSERYAGGEERIVYEETGEMQYEVFNFSDVEKRVGLFNKTTGTGVGVYFFKNGSQYIGEFDNNSFKGIGRYTYENGTHSAITLFQNDQIISDSMSFTERRSVVKGNIPVLVVLVSYQDISIAASEKVWSLNFFGKAHSLQQYYDQISGHRVKLIPADESFGVRNDGVVSIKFAKNHPRGENQYGDTAIEVSKALQGIDQYIDFSAYDSNKDGQVSSRELMIIQIVAGYEGAVSREMGPIIYAHQGELSESDRILDDVDVLSYVQCAEQHYHKEQTPATKLASLALIAHEIGHLFGIPDLYDTDYSSYGVGPFSLMGTGTMIETPGKIEGSGIPEMDPYSKSYLGWVEPELIEYKGTYTLFSPESSKYNCFKIQIDDNRYLLIEYRPLSGNDDILKAVINDKQGGVLIWKIDETVINASEGKNQVNDEDGNEGIELIEAKEQRDSRIGLNEIGKWDVDPYFRAAFENKFSPQNHQTTKAWETALPTIEIIRTGEDAVIRIDF